MTIVCYIWRFPDRKILSQGSAPRNYRYSYAGGGLAAFLPPYTTLSSAFIRWACERDSEEYLSACPHQLASVDFIKISGKLGSFDVWYEISLGVGRTVLGNIISPSR
jgi:hypothetical protein